jgi:hypothetical protein
LCLTWFRSRHVAGLGSGLSYRLRSLQPRVLGILGMAWLRWRDATFKPYYPMARETWRGEVWCLVETRGLYVAVRGQVMRRRMKEGHGCVLISEKRRDEGARLDWNGLPVLWAASYY